MLLSSLSLSAKPILELSEEIVDFGDVNIADGAQTKMLVIKNVGDELMVVNNVSSPCHCVETEWSTKTVAPNSTDSIKVILIPDVSGVVSKKLVVYSNAKNKRVAFRVKAKAIRKK